MKRVCVQSPKSCQSHQLEQDHFHLLGDGQLCSESAMMVGHVWRHCRIVSATDPTFLKDNLVNGCC